MRARGQADAAAHPGLDLHQPSYTPCPPAPLAGMTWSAFRPSDDPSNMGFPIAANMYAAAGLERALELNRQVGRASRASGWPAGGRELGCMAQ